MKKIVSLLIIVSLCLSLFSCTPDSSPTEQGFVIKDTGEEYIWCRGVFAVNIGDVFVTVTGCRDVITPEHFAVMKDGAIMCNAGHFNVEVDVESLSKIAESEYEARHNIQGYRMADGRNLFVIAPRPPSPSPRPPQTPFPRHAG